MATLITMLLNEGDPLSFRILDGDQARDVQVTLAEVNAVMSVRTLVALHTMLGEAVAAKRAQLGEQWADEFPPTLDLESGAAA